MKWANIFFGRICARRNSRDKKGSLDRVLKLKPSSFYFNNDEYNLRFGFIAQDVEKVIPEAVGERDGFKTVNYAMLGA